MQERLVKALRRSRWYTHCLGARGLASCSIDFSTARRPAELSSGRAPIRAMRENNMRADERCSIILVQFPDCRTNVRTIALASLDYHVC
jgi:hypothetical protein